MTAFTGGGLHSSFWIVDRMHIYIGSADMSWRSLSKVTAQRNFFYPFTGSISCILTTKNLQKTAYLTLCSQPAVKVLKVMPSLCLEDLCDLTGAMIISRSALRGPLLQIASSNRSKRKTFLLPAEFSGWME